MLIRILTKRKNVLPADEVANVVQQEATSGDKVGGLPKDFVMKLCLYDCILYPQQHLILLIIVTTCQTEPLL